MLLTIDIDRSLSCRAKANKFQESRSIVSKNCVSMDHAYWVSTTTHSSGGAWQMKRGRTVTTLGGTTIGSMSQPMPTGVHVQVSSVINIPGEVLTD
jgi:hypothetical protein